MLRVNLPELLIFNPSLVEGLFDEIWKEFLKLQLVPERWDAYRGDFFTDSQSVFYETFTRCVEEVVNSANLGRPFDLEYVTFDYTSLLDSYSYEASEEMDEDEELAVECKMFEFFHFAIDKVICQRFLDAAYQRLLPCYNTLITLAGQYNIVGFWYECCVGQISMYDGRGHLWAIQPSDYETMHYGQWDGAIYGTKFFHLSKGDGSDFYFYNNSLIQESSMNLIPKGENVTLCRLTEASMQTMDL